MEGGRSKGEPPGPGEPGGEGGTTPEEDGVSFLRFIVNARLKASMAEPSTLSHSLSLSLLFSFIFSRSLSLFSSSSSTFPAILIAAAAA